MNQRVTSEENNKILQGTYHLKHLILDLKKKYNSLNLAQESMILRMLFGTKLNKSWLKVIVVILEQLKKGLKNQIKNYKRK